MKGIGAAEGIGIGRAVLFKRAELIVEKRIAEDDEHELRKFYDALTKAESEMKVLYEYSLKGGLREEGEILKAHIEFLRDPEFKSAVEKKICEEHLIASWAIDAVAKEFIALLESMDNEYMKERALDIKDVSLRLQRHVLNAKTESDSEIGERSIVVAEELTPSDIIQMDKSKIDGFIVQKGGQTSHTAILAKAMKIPAIFGARGLLSRIQNGDLICMNGETGEFLINPADEEFARFKSMRAIRVAEKSLLAQMIGAETKSADGYVVKTEANIGSLQELNIAVENDAEGIGLFRTEFLFIGRDSMPTEEEQIKVYREAVQKMGSKPVTIRTLDVGGDKDIPYLNLPKESNPFLGYRAIRFCLEETEVFKTQLSAILRASAFGNLKIMFPMISSVEELRKAKGMLEAVKDGLRKKGVSFNENIKVGIMIEVPAAAIMSDALAKEVDFFSIGTNDLIQYCIAVDRMNDKMSDLYTPYHPAVLRLIRLVIDNGHKNGIKVGMCGQMAALPEFVPILLGMGLDEFSIPPSSILKIRKIISGIFKTEMVEIAEKLMQISTASELRKTIENKARL